MAKKHWIEPGSFVQRVVGPDIPITVDKIIKEDGFDHHGSPMTYILGIECHWLTEQGIYQNGILRTDEVRPYIKIGDNVKITKPG